MRCGPHIDLRRRHGALRPLGQDLVKDGPITADLFFTHTHLDHMIGVPFFAPLYQKDSNIRLWAGHLEPPRSIKDALSGMMVEPLFRCRRKFSVRPSFHDFKGRRDIEPFPASRFELRLSTIPTAPPAIGSIGKSICYITDCEHDGHGPEGIVELIKGADIFIYDLTYTEDEYPRFKGWGHSTWQEGVRITRTPPG